MPALSLFEQPLWPGGTPREIVNLLRLLELDLLELRTAERDLRSDETWRYLIESYFEWYHERLDGKPLTSEILHDHLKHLLKQVRLTVI